MVTRQPYAIHDGLAVYRIGDGVPIFLMPGPHRYQRPGLRSADALIDGLVRLGRQVVTFDPPGLGLALVGSLHLMARRLGSERVLNNFIDRQSFHDQGYARPQPVTLADWLRPAAGRAEWHRVAKYVDYAARLGEIAMPVLLLCGLHDPQYPPACSFELAAGIGHAELVFFERSGHYPFIEEPEAFWAAVNAFLTGLAAHPATASSAAGW